jgi:flotillin
MISVSMIITAVIVVFILILLFSGYLKAPPDVAYIISGIRKKPRILVGKAGIRIPFFERVDKLALGAIQIDVKTKSSIPTAEYINVKVDSTVAVRVGRDPEMIALAAQNFLNINRDTIALKINDLLEGNIREIVGQMKLTEMVSDRKSFSEKVQVNVVPDLAKLGLELVTFNVQNFVDDNSVIDNLGIDNVEQIRKNAAIAKSDAQREIAIAEAENAKTANDAKVKAAEEIAKRNNDLAIKQAELKKEADAKKAQADAALAIEAENQRKVQEVATADANLARQEKEIELKAREVEIKERALEAEIKKTAEAKKYAEQQDADAKLYATQKAAEADLFERQRQAEAAKIEAEKKAEADLALANADAAAKKALAEAVKAQGEAEAAAEKAKGLAEAEAIKAKAEAEAEGLMKKAEAMKQYGDAAMADMQMQAIKAYFEQLPAIAEAVGQGYQGVDKIVMLGNDSSQLAGNIMNTTTQISEGLSQSIGIDLKSLLAGFLGGKIATNGTTDEQ